MREYKIHKVLSCGNQQFFGVLVLYEKDTSDNVHAAQVWREDHNTWFEEDVKWTDGESKVVFNDDGSFNCVYLQRSQSTKTIPPISKDTPEEIL